MVDVARHKEQLERRYAELRSRLSRIETELEEPVSDNFSEQATEREDSEVLQDLGAAGLQEIRMIESALDRIEKGTYGICASCGEAISDARLDAVPHAQLCQVCAAGG